MPKARKMLSNWEAPYIWSLMKLIETQSKTTLTTWAVAVENEQNRQKLIGNADHDSTGTKTFYVKIGGM